MARPLAFLTFHAGELGRVTPRVKIYTYQPSSPNPDASAEAQQRLFIPWTTAQQRRLGQSHQLARALQQRLAEIQGLTTDSPEGVPARALRSIDAPAVAIEIGTLSPQTDAAPLTNPNLLQQISNAVAVALQSFQGEAS